MRTLLCSVEGLSKIDVIVGDVFVPDVQHRFYTFICVTGLVTSYRLSQECLTHSLVVTVRDRYHRCDMCAHVLPLHPHAIRAQ